MARQTKNIIKQTLGYTLTINKYLELDRKIKQLEKEKAELADHIRMVVLNIPAYDYSVKYEIDGLIRTSHKVENAINQIAAFEAFKKPTLRNILFPTAVEFKPGKNKDLASEHGLLIRTYGNNPVIEVL